MADAAERPSEMAHLLQVFQPVERESGFGQHPRTGVKKNWLARPDEAMVGQRKPAFASWMRRVLRTPIARRIKGMMRARKCRGSNVILLLILKVYRPD